MPNAKALMDKIQALPVERIAEVEDFVDFIQGREQERAVVRAATAASVPSFATIWNNPEDDAYDAVISKPDLVMMAITSRVRPTPAFGEVWIDRWQAAGPLKPSVAKPVFATFEHLSVIRQLGTLDPADRND